MNLGITTKANPFRGTEYVVELELANAHGKRFRAVRHVLLFVAVVAWAIRHPVTSIRSTIPTGTRFWSIGQAQPALLANAMQ